MVMRSSEGLAGGVYGPHSSIWISLHLAVCLARFPHRLHHYIRKGVQLPAACKKSLGPSPSSGSRTDNDKDRHHGKQVGRSCNMLSSRFKVDCCPIASIHHQIPRKVVACPPNKQACVQYRVCAVHEHMCKTQHCCLPAHALPDWGLVDQPLQSPALHHGTAYGAQTCQRKPRSVHW